MNRIDIAVLDITGRTGTYDDCLCNALSKFEPIMLFTPNCRKKEHINSYPTFKFCGIDTTIKPVGVFLKAFLGIINYTLFGLILFIKKYKIVHIQWLPYLEKNEIERCFLSIYHVLSPRTKFVFTIHNVYPHNSDDHKKKIYRERFRRIVPSINHFMVHTESTKNVVIKEFGITPGSISVVYHGTFSPTNMPVPSKNTDDSIKILMYGNQTYYKGTDIFVKASMILKRQYGLNVKVKVLGMTSKDLLDEYYECATEAGIEWIPNFIENEDLYQEIVDSNLLVFPYRAISQSGALLMALPFRKPIILSNLPSFVETMEDYPEDCFVEVDSVESLFKVMEGFVEGKLDSYSILRTIDSLNKKYSWEESAKKLCDIYRNL